MTITRNNLFNISTLALRVFSRTRVKRSHGRNNITIRATFFLRNRHRRNGSLITIRLLALFITTGTTINVTIGNGTTIGATFRRDLFRVFRVNATRALISILTIELGTSGNTLYTRAKRRLLHRNDQDTIYAISTSIRTNRITISKLVRIVRVILRTIVTTMRATRLNANLRLGTHTVIISMNFSLILRLIQRLVTNANGSLSTIRLRQVIKNESRSTNVNVMLTRRVNRDKH